MPVGDLYKVTTVMRLGEQNSLCVSWWKTTAVVGTQPTEQAMVNALDTFWAGDHKGVMAAQASWRGTILQYHGPAAPGLPVFSTANAGAGTASGDPLPTNTAGLMGFTCGYAGRNYRGRKYIGFPAEDDNVTGGRPSSGYLVNLGAIAAKYLSGLTVGSGGNTATLKYYILQPSLGTATQVTAYYVRDKWAHQDRRATETRGDASLI